MPKKSYTYPLKCWTNQLLFLRNCNTKFDDTAITITDENATPWEMED